MKHLGGGQSSHNSGDDRESEFVRHWSAVRIETLREFASELCNALTLRGAAAATGLSKEGLRKLVEGESHPNRSTRQTLGEMFLKLYPGGTMWKNSQDGKWQLRVQLIELLSPGEEAARTELAKIFELAKRFPGEAPASVDAVHEWLDLQVQGEYWGRRYLDSFGKRKRQPKGKARRPRKRKDEAAEEGE